MAACTSTDFRKTRGVCSWPVNPQQRKLEIADVDVAWSFFGGGNIFYIRPVLSSFFVGCVSLLGSYTKKEMLSELANFKPFNLAAQLQERPRENHEINLLGWVRITRISIPSKGTINISTGKEKSSSNMPVGDILVRRRLYISFFSKPTLIFIPLSIHPLFHGLHRQEISEASMYGSQGISWGPAKQGIYWAGPRVKDTVDASEIRLTTWMVLKYW